MTDRWLMLLDRSLDARAYRDRHDRGLEPDSHPYGAEHIQAGVAYSRPTSGRISRRIGSSLGFDIWHAWRNRDGISRADVIYCHTEHQYLGAALVLLLLRKRKPFLAGQTIWLYEGRSRFPRIKRAALQRLIGRVDLLVYNARPNFVAGRRDFPKAHHVYLPFGVSKVFAAARHAPGGERLVLSVGTDRARDWATLGAAMREVDATLRVATGTAPAGIDPASVKMTSGTDELVELYSRAAVVVVPTVENLHASGITSMLEAAAVGVPIVASRTGGLDEYFSEEEVRYVPAGSAAALAAALREALDDHSAICGRAAQDRVEASGYDNRQYWERVAAAVRQRHSDHPRP